VPHFPAQFLLPIFRREASSLGSFETKTGRETLFHAQLLSIRHTDSKLLQVTGFGGNGTTTNSSDPYSYCVTDGPFTKLKLSYKSNNTHSHRLNPTIITGVNSNTDFLSFHSALEGGPHNIVHAGIGGSYGDMGPLTSPNGMFIFPCLLTLSFFAEFSHVGVWNVENLARANEFLDPIFFLHHTQVDRLWWLWQQVSPSNRTNDYAGNLPDGSAASLTDLMPMMGLASDRMVSAFMSTQTTDLCYKY
jgi:tyrosinase